MSLKLADVVEANRMLMALGGEDQMQRIAAASIERSLELQNRLDRALAYAAQTPPNSVHARQMARILDGSITIDDELNEVREHDRPLHEMPAREPVAALHAAPDMPVRRTRGPNKKKQPVVRSGLAGRTSNQRKEFRAWAEEQGYTVPKQGPVAVELVQEFDDWKAAERKRLAEERRAAREGQLPL